MAVPTFGPVSVDIYEQGGLIRAGDVVACRRLKYLSEELTLSALNGTHHHARGSWGHTILRTVYTPESDDSFGPAIERLKRWVRHGLVSGHRLLSRPRPREVGDGIADGELDPDAELWRRFYVDVVEDREGLAGMDGDFAALRESLTFWIASNIRFWLAPFCPLYKQNSTRLNFGSASMRAGSAQVLP